jgi:nitrite reductase/ring-hydroxylating ferredoxin subunit
MNLERRKFIQDGCKACLLFGSGFLISELTACGPTSQIIRLPVSAGTVQLPLAGFAKQSMQIVRPEGWVYDIAVRKIDDGLYEALFLQCTHQKNQVIPEGNGFICPLHGSRYNPDGKVKKGPAEMSLRKFPVHEESGDLVIELKP